jgi:predicted metal-dependent hydrolase
MINSSAKKLSTTHLLVQDIKIELTRKNVKNLNLRITQPEGLVRVSAPKRMPVDVIYAFVISKYDWILLQQEKLQAHVNQTTFVFDTGETHYYFGEKYELQLIESDAKPKVALNEHILELHINPESSYKQRQSVIEAWYRDQLKQQIPILIKKYERLMNLEVLEFGIKKMKTRWGTCNPKAKRIWLNLELARKSFECLEYVILHEMTHFLEPKHNQRFYNLVSEYMPNWKVEEQKLSLI